jgi:uncharacterized protein (DUF1684 family)
MRFASLALLALALAACADPNAPRRPADSTLQSGYDAWRADRDSTMRSAASPLPTRDPAGLRYFDFDAAFAVALDLQPYPSPDTVRLATSTGVPQAFTRHATASFDLGGTRQRLTVFRPVGPGAGYLFVPFSDPTNGRETYGAGRYVEVEETSGTAIVLDFNRAYNPYCAYNARYVCPLPPEENRLTVPVEAGEKLPTAEAAAGGM